MGKLGMVKKTLAMFMLVFLVASLTAASASAWYDDHGVKKVEITKIKITEKERCHDFGCFDGCFDRDRCFCGGVRCHFVGYRFFGPRCHWGYC